MDFRNLPRAPEAAQKGHNELGAMPTWNLADLYPSNDSPELKSDLAAAQSEAKAFEADYKGKLVTLFGVDQQVLQDPLSGAVMGDQLGQVVAFGCRVLGVATHVEIQPRAISEEDIGTAAP